MLNAARRARVKADRQQKERGKGKQNGRFTIKDTLSMLVISLEKILQLKLNNLRILDICQGMWLFKFELRSVLILFPLSFFSLFLFLPISLSHSIFCQLFPYFFFFYLLYSCRKNTLFSTRFHYCFVSVSSRSGFLFCSILPPFLFSLSFLSLSLSSFIPILVLSAFFSPQFHIFVLLLFCLPSVLKPSNFLI